MFTGEYRHSVDDKGRVAVPVRFRPELASGAMVCKWTDGSVAIFPRAAWETLASKASGLQFSDINARTFQRFLSSASFEVELDRQGRLVVPAILRDFGGLTGETVVVVGSFDHLELWSPERWRAYSAEMDQPEVLANHLQGLGI